MVENTTHIEGLAKEITQDKADHQPKKPNKQGTADLDKQQRQDFEQIQNGQFTQMYRSSKESGGENEKWTANSVSA